LASVLSKDGTIKQKRNVSMSVDKDWGMILVARGSVYRHFDLAR
jgi:hypothetical protein